MYIQFIFIRFEKVSYVHRQMDLSIIPWRYSTNRYRAISFFHLQSLPSLCFFYFSKNCKENKITVAWNAVLGSAGRSRQSPHSFAWQSSGQPFYILYKYNLFKMDMARNFKNGANTGVKNESKRSKRHGHSSLGSFPTHINRSLFRKQMSTKKITSAWRLVFLALTGNVGANEQKAHSIWCVWQDFRIDSHRDDPLWV